MEILTVLGDLYHVNPDDEWGVMDQIKHGMPELFFTDGKKTVCLMVNNIVSIEYFEELK